MYSLLVLSAIPAIYAAPLAFRRDACTTGHVQCNASSGTVAVCIEGSHRTLGPITGLDCSQVPASLIGAVTSDKTSLRRRQDIGCDNGFHCDSDMNEFALCMNDVVVARIDVAGGICPFIFPKSTPLEPSTSSSAPAPPGPTPTPAPAPPAAPVKKRQEESEPENGAAPDQGNPGDGEQTPDPDVPSDETIASDAQDNEAGGETGGETGGENGGGEQQDGTPGDTADDLIQPPSTECVSPASCGSVNTDVPVVDQGGITPVGAEGVPIEDPVVPAMEPEKRQEGNYHRRNGASGDTGNDVIQPRGTECINPHQCGSVNANIAPAINPEKRQSGCGFHCTEDGGATEP